jgi:hypothetical protein
MIDIGVGCSCSLPGPLYGWWAFYRLHSSSCGIRSWLVAELLGLADLELLLVLTEADQSGGCSYSLGGVVGL